MLNMKGSEETSPTLLVGPDVSLDVIYHRYVCMSTFSPRYMDRVDVMSHKRTISVSPPFGYHESSPIKTLLVKYIKIPLVF